MTRHTRFSAETQARARMHEKNRSLRVAASLESSVYLKEEVL